jgi:hypothetical protein
MEMKPTEKEWQDTLSFYELAQEHVEKHAYLEFDHTGEIIDVWSLSAFVQVWDKLTEERKQITAWMCGGNPFGLCSFALQFVEPAFKEGV